MGSRVIADDETVEAYVRRGYAGLADEFAYSGRGSVGRDGNTVVAVLDGERDVTEWDTPGEAMSAYNTWLAEIRAPGERG